LVFVYAELNLLSQVSRIIMVHHPPKRFRLLRRPRKIYDHPIDRCLRSIACAVITLSNAACVLYLT